MVFIIGGAYQGKLDFAMRTFSLTQEDIFICSGAQIDFSKRCIYKIEEFAKYHPDPIGYFETHRDRMRDSILIMEDLFCGVVPMGAETRAWRQNAGRLSQYLSREASQVSRIFCGLEHRLK